jgi:hypothetical protein
MRVTSNIFQYLTQQLLTHYEHPLLRGQIGPDPPSEDTVTCLDSRQTSCSVLARSLRMCLVPPCGSGLPAPRLQSTASRDDSQRMPAETGSDNHLPRLPFIAQRVDTGGLTDGHG